MHHLPTRAVADPRAVVTGDRYRITVLTDGLLRLEHSPDGVFEDRASTFAVNRELPVPQFRVVEHDDRLELVTDRLRLVYDRGPFSPGGLAVHVRGGVTAYHSVWRYGASADDDGGSLGASLAGPAQGTLGGTARTLDEADGAVPLGPGVVSTHGFAVLDDSSSMLLDGDAFVGRDGSRTDLYVFAYGHDHRAALRAFHAVSGHAPVLPRWALGSWWSRFHRYSAESYLALLDRFQAEGLPFSVAVVDMDWHVTDVDPALGSGWTGYTWNRDLFPEPAKFLAGVHDRGLRVTLNVHPADGVRSHEEAYAEMARVLGRDTSAGDPIDLDVTDPAFLRAYLDVLHRRLEDDGVDFWWVDWQSGPHSRTPGVDPLWVLNHAHYLDNARDDRRALTFSRYAGPGSHRYPVGFSGDSVVSWASLDFQPYFTATAANIGYGWWSHDVGGHFHGIKDDELATRWVQLGLYSPILRLHSSDSPFMTKEPWTFGPAAHAAMTDALRMRARLVPYLHTMNHRAHREDVPLVTPLYHSWPAAPEAYAARSSFMFGSSLLVAPITAPADDVTLLGAVRTWLPSGTWVDVHTGLAYDGDRETVLHRPLDHVPALAPAGALVPLDAAAVPGNDPVNPLALEVLVVVGADGAFDLVEDDGTPADRTATTALRFTQATGTFAVGPAAPDDDGPAPWLPARRTWTATFLAVDEACDDHVEAFVDDVPVAARVVRAGSRLSITVEDVAVTSDLGIRIGDDPRLAAVDVEARATEVLDRARCEYDLKTRLLRIAVDDRPLHVRVSHLRAVGAAAGREAVVDAVLEVLLARG
ncbi:glycoside hydrolase family 31 protein [Cellulomonas sp. HZM]|uniref:glycoside hydrolase family 31 protein n=1 Tax=Cellulomonas sp. HZM TaxID=1454010 RepID=UPI0004939086|nr:TIM-barrel domain-containing protein [Cellulomonas sp. HZM]